MEKRSSTWSFVTHKLKSMWVWIALLILVTIFSIALNSVSPLIYRVLIDEAIPKQAFSQLIWFVVLFISIPVLSLCINMLSSRCSYYITGRVYQVLNRKGFEHCLNMNYPEFEKKGTYSLMYTITRGPGKICQVFMGGDLLLMITNGIQLIIVFSIMVTMNWQVAVFCVAMTPLIYFAFKIYRKKIRDMQDGAMRLAKKGEALMLNSFDGIKTVRTCQGKQREMDKLAAWSEENYKIKWKAHSAHMVSRTITPAVIQQLMYGIVFIICAYFVMYQDMSIGSLVAITSYVPVIFTAITGLLSIQLGVSSVAGIVDDLDEILDAPSEGGTESFDLSKPITIELNNVEFSYDREGFRLSIPSLTIEPGTFLCIVGGSGGGKSSVMDILCRFFPAAKGEIKVNGQNIYDLSPDSLRSIFSVVPQDVYLWEDNIENNIIYPEDTADKQKLAYTVEASSLGEFIDNLPEKMNTSVGNYGQEISGGERQRISIARALYRDAPVLLLDEPTAALDSETSKKIMDAVWEQAHEKGKTVIMITHDIQRSLSADSVIVIHKGEIAEQGAPRELLKKDGQFRNLYDSATKHRE